MTGAIAPLAVLGFVAGALGVAVGARDFGRKLIIVSLLLGAAIPTLLSMTQWFLATVVPVLKIVFAVHLVAAVVVAGARFADRRRKLLPPNAVPKLAVKRRVEGE